MAEVTMMVENSLATGDPTRPLFLRTARQTLKLTVSRTTGAGDLPLPADQAAFIFSGLKSTALHAPDGWTTAPSTTRPGGWDVFTTARSWDNAPLDFLLDITGDDTAALTGEVPVILVWRYPTAGGRYTLCSAHLTVNPAAPGVILPLDVLIRVELLTPSVAVVGTARNPNVVRIAIHNTGGKPLVAAPSPEARPVFYIDLPHAENGFDAVSTAAAMQDVHSVVDLNAARGGAWSNADNAPGSAPGGTADRFEFLAPPEVLATGDRVVLALINVVSDLPLPGSGQDVVVIIVGWRDVPGYDDGHTTLSLGRRVAEPWLNIWCDPELVVGSGTVRVSWQSVGLTSLELHSDHPEVFADYDPRKPKAGAFVVDADIMAYGWHDFALVASAASSGSIGFEAVAKVPFGIRPAATVAATVALRQQPPEITALKIDPYPAAPGEKVTVSWQLNQASYVARVQRLDGDEPHDGDPLGSVEHQQRATCVFKASGRYRLIAAATDDLLRAALCSADPQANGSAVACFDLRSVADYLPGTSFQSSDEPSCRLDFDDQHLRLSGIADGIDPLAGVAFTDTGIGCATPTDGGMRQIYLAMPLIRPTLFAMDPSTWSADAGTTTRLTGSGFTWQGAGLGWEGDDAATAVAALAVPRQWTEIDRRASMLDRDFVLASNIEFEPWFVAPAKPGGGRQILPIDVGVISRCRETLQLKGDGSCTYHLESDDVAGAEQLLGRFYMSECALGAGPAGEWTGTWSLSYPQLTVELPVAGTMTFHIVGNALRIAPGSTLPTLTRSLSTWPRPTPPPSPKPPPVYDPVEWRANRHGIGPGNGYPARPVTPAAQPAPVDRFAEYRLDMTPFTAAHPYVEQIHATRRSWTFLDGHRVGPQWQWPLSPSFSYFEDVTLKAVRAMMKEAEMMAKETRHFGFPSR